MSFGVKKWWVENRVTRSTTWIPIASGTGRGRPTARRAGRGGHGQVQHRGEARSRMASSAAERRAGRSVPVQVGYQEVVSRGMGGVSGETEKGRSQRVVRERRGGNGG